MKTNIKSQVVLALMLGLVSGCQEFGNGTTSSGSDLMSLSQMASDVSASDSASDGTQTVSQCPIGEPPPPPDLSRCETDLTTLCSDDPLPTEATSHTEAPRLMKAAIDCLKSHEDDLSSACQTQLSELPPPPPQANGQRPPPPPQNGSGDANGQRPDDGQRADQLPPACGNAGYGLLGPCNADAQTYCASALPTRSDYEQMTLAERLQTLESVVTCLTENAGSVSSACQSALGDATSAAPSSGN